MIFTKKRVGIVLLFFVMSQAVFADDLSSTKRSAGSVPTGSISSTIRSGGPSKPDPMLNTNMGEPADAISTTNETGSSTDPMLNTSGAVPTEAISTTTKTPHQDPMLSTSAGFPSSAISTTKMGNAKLDPSLCNALTKHTPRADVAYQSGVDGNGKAVAPADMPGSPQMQLPSKINIPLTVNLAQTLNLDTTKYPFNTLGAGTEAWLGTLSVEEGNVTFNGKPLSYDQQENLAVVCMDQK